MTLPSRRTVLLGACALAAFPLVAWAQPAPSPLALAGRWTSSASRPDGTVITVTVTITQALAFSGTAESEGRVVWEFGGTLSLQDRELTWRYERSSIALPDAMKIDIDDLLRVEADELELRSRRTGRQQVFRRVRTGG